MSKKTSAATKVTLPNDFERMIPEYHKDTIIYGEHIVRYLAAQELVLNKIVLDIASGSGYGTLSLAKTAKKVFGVDVNKAAIDYSKQNFNASNIEYLVGDGTKIPLPDDAVDVVVSFETIEHIENYAIFMDEVKRVLKKDGLFILSTPNDVEFAEGNHFHIHEFERKELKSLAKKYFSNVKEYFQADWIYSGIHSEKELTDHWGNDLKVLNRVELKLDQALYFFMLCANRDIKEEIKSFGVLAEHYSAKVLQNKQNLTDKHIQNILDIAESAKQETGSRQEKIEQLKTELNAILESKSWKLISKIRRIKNRLTP